MDLVWTDGRQSKQLSKDESAIAFEPRSQSEEAGSTLAPINRPIRFVQNGAKRRRQASRLPDTMNLFMTTMHASPTIIEDEDEPDHLYDGLPTNSPDSLPSAEDRVKPLEVDINNNTGPNTIIDFPESSESAVHSSSSSFDDFASDIFPSTESVIDSSSELSWQTNMLEGALTPYHIPPRRNHMVLLDPFPLSPGPLYSSPTRKASAILDMCECTSPTFALPDNLTLLTSFQTIMNFVYCRSLQTARATRFVYERTAAKAPSIFSMRSWPYQHSISQRRTILWCSLRRCKTTKRRHYACSVKP